MSKIPRPTRIIRRKLIDALHLAIDQTYQELVATAKADWERLFAGQNAGDESAQIRVSDVRMSEELAEVPRAGVVPVRAKPVNGKVRRRLA